ASARPSTPAPFHPAAIGWASACTAATAASNRGASNPSTSPRRRRKRARTSRLPPRLGEREAGLTEEAGGGDQGQADEGGRVLRLDGLEQHDAQPLGLEAARAIERLLRIDVAADLVVGQVAEAHCGRVQRGEGTAVGASQAYAGAERDATPAHAAQL